MTRILPCNSEREREREKKREREREGWRKGERKVRGGKRIREEMKKGQEDRMRRKTEIKL